MIVGAGRLARAIAVALADAGVSAITVVSRNGRLGPNSLSSSSKQQTAVAGYARRLSGGTIAVEPDIAVLVNATSLGMDDPRRQAAARSELVRVQTGRGRRGL